jgi:hypothetical protein
MRIGTLLFTLLISVHGSAQKIDSIFFNLYTDSLKKGFYNYINVDGKCADGTWLPLDSTHIKLTTNAGLFNGNSIFIDSSYMGDSIKVKAVLRSNRSIWKEATIYIRRRGFDELLKTDADLLNSLPVKKKKQRRGRLHIG